MDEARTTGVAAWTAARDSWPESNPNKGALAYNAAWVQVMVGQGASAREAAAAAVSLARDPGPYLPAEARLLLAAADLASAGPEAPRALVTAVADAAEPLEQLDAPDPVVGLLLADVARRELASNRYTASRQLSSRAIAALAKSGEGRSHSSIQPYLTRGMAQIALDNDLRAALSSLKDINTALVLWGPPGEEPPEAYFRLLSWYAALRGLALSQGARDFETKRNAFGDDFPDEDPRFDAQSGPDCPDDMTKTAGPAIFYPNSALFAGRVGGAVIVAQLAPDGQVTDARVTASIPGPAFGQQAASAIRSWRYEVPAGTDARCLQNKRIVVSYAIED
jgi:TonB family protein